MYYVLAANTLKSCCRIIVLQGRTVTKPVLDGFAIYVLLQISRSDVHVCLPNSK